MFSIRPFIYLYIVVILMVRKGMQIYLFLGRFFHMLYSLSVYLFIILRSTTWASLINVYFIIYFQKEGKEDSAIYTKVTFGWQVKCFFLCLTRAHFQCVVRDALFYSWYAFAFAVFHEAMWPLPFYRLLSFVS